MLKFIKYKKYFYCPDEEQDDYFLVASENYIPVEKLSVHNQHLVYEIIDPSFSNMAKERCWFFGDNGTWVSYKDGLVYLWESGYEDLLIELTTEKVEELGLDKLPLVEIQMGQTGYIAYK